MSPHHESTHFAHRPPDRESDSGASAAVRAAGGGRRCLVTGGSGFIGSHLVETLLARGDSVTIIDNLSTGRRPNLARAEAMARGPSSLRFIEADLSGALEALGPGEVFDEIYHLAAAVGVKLVVDKPIEAIRVNIEQTFAILRFAASRKTTAGAKGIPTLIASSSEVYGKSPEPFFREDADVVYGPTTVSRWSYAYSKAIDEFLALTYAEREGLPTVVVRFFNTVGPRQVGEYGMVLPRFVRAAVAGEDLTIHGNGTQSRCFCDVRDVVEALPRLMESSACLGKVFNVGSDKPLTISALADLVISLTGSRSRKVFVPYNQVFGGGFEDLHERRPDLSRIRGAIGFEPRVPLEQTIRDVAAGLRAQELES